MVKVKVCCGTSCYIMGSSELISMGLDSCDGVDFEGSTCMNLCKDNEKRPPYVSINDEIYSQVTSDQLKKLVEEKLNAV